MSERLENFKDIKESELLICPHCGGTNVSFRDPQIDKLPQEEGLTLTLEHVCDDCGETFVSVWKFSAAVYLQM